MSQATSELREELVSTCRTTVGDELRSVTYFTEDDVEQLYLRDDLEQDADLVGFAETERLGFRAQRDYSETELGEYLFTVRMFDEGYLLRTIVEDSGMFVTTDTMARQRFEDLVAGVEPILAD